MTYLSTSQSIALPSIFISDFLFKINNKQTSNLSTFLCGRLIIFLYREGCKVHHASLSCIGHDPYSNINHSL